VNGNHLLLPYRERNQYILENIDVCTYAVIYVYTGISETLLCDFIYISMYAETSF